MPNEHHYLNLKKKNFIIIIIIIVGGSACRASKVATRLAEQGDIYTYLGCT